MHLGLEGVVPTTLWIAEILFFFLSAFKEPALGIYLLVPLMPLESVRYRLHGYELGPQFVDILLLGVLLGLKRQGLPILPKTPLNALLFTFIVFTYISMARGSAFLDISFPLWFGDPRVSNWKNFVVDLSLVFFLTCGAIRTKRQIGILLITSSIGILLLTKNFHSAIADRDFSSFSYNLRDAGTMGGAGINGLAALAAQVSVFFLALFLVERRVLKKVGYIAIVTASGYCVLFALSRGAYAALLVGAMFLGLVRSRWVLLGVVGFLMTWQALVPPAVRDRVLMTADQNGEVEHSAASRLSLWDEAIQVFQADPIFGTGFETYAYRSHVGGYGDTHNLFVKLLVETGLTGLVLFLMIMLRLFRIGFRLHRTATDPFLKAIGLGFSGLMISALVANVFGDRWMYFQITGYTYAFAALAVRAQQITDEGMDAQEENPDDEPTGCMQLAETAAQKNSS